MAHAAYADLHDLAALLDKIRSLPDIQEPRPGIFYFKRTPFLHFHTRAGQRWADAKDGATWGTEINLPFAADPACKESAWKTIQTRYETTRKALSPRPRQ